MARLRTHFTNTMKSFHFLLTPILLLGTISVTHAAEWSESKALAALASDTQEKARACQALAVVGGPESVPVLAELLSDLQLAAYARTALEVIDHPSAGEALLNAVPNLQGRLLVGVATSLGVRGDEAAVASLQELAGNHDVSVSQSAISALGRIGTDEALATVVGSLNRGPESLRISAAHAALAAAEKMLQSGNKKRATALLDSIQSAVIPDYIRSAASTLSKK